MMMVFFTWFFIIMLFRYAYISFETTRNADGVVYKKLYPVLADPGTPCSVDGQDGVSKFVWTQTVVKTVKQCIYFSGIAHSKTVKRRHIERKLNTFRYNIS